MNFLSNTWVLWFVLAAVIGGLMGFYRESRRSAQATGMFASQDEFSIKTILFGFKRGEGDLFLGYLGAMICFSLLLAGFVRWIQNIL